MEHSILNQAFKTACKSLCDFCEYPAVQYNILFRLLGMPYDSAEVSALREDFLASDIVSELCDEQDIHGGWGALQSKDYSAKAKFPTSLVAINRALYIGLAPSDRNILSFAAEYLEAFLTGDSIEKFRATNERVIPWNTATVCTALEGIAPNNPLCDDTFNKWLYIADRAYESGEYSYERERFAQHEVFWTHEERLVPMQIGLLLKRREQIPEQLEHSMLLHHGEHAYHNGHFWTECPAKLPQEFVYNKTRRWFHSFNYINQFRGSEAYLEHVVDWLFANQNQDGLWDFGPQIKDPWGYFGYFSLTRKYAHNRVVDCSMEVLSFLKKYIENNF